MQKRKIILFTVGTIFLAAASYSALRWYATSVADRDIDAFFASFHGPDARNAEAAIIIQAQDPQKTKEIVSRNIQAIQNFNYSELAPDLNVALDKTRIEVSWHLAIVFSKSQGHWHLVVFDEFDSEKQTHNQAIQSTSLTLGD